jgi:hypothetical protein
MVLLLVYFEYANVEPLRLRPSPPGGTCRALTPPLIAYTLEILAYEENTL